MEAIILSLVRSNDVGEVGFLRDYRRINVAVTRARRHLAVVCDSETVSRDKHLTSFIEFLQDRADVRTAEFYCDDVVRDYSRSSHAVDLDKAPITRMANDAKPLRIQLQVFMKAIDQTQLIFPISTTSYQRMLIHEFLGSSSREHW